MTLRHSNGRARSSGFTLVELMVALTGGLFVSLAVFALARDSGRFYQREARIANATISGLLGFDRLRADIARAGFLSSPNAVQDLRHVCGAPQANWPAALQNLASIQVTPGTANAALTSNQRTPPLIRLAGSYASADVYSVRIQRAGNTTVFNLESGQPSLLRLGNGANPDNATMQTVFPASRALRIVQNGWQYYGQIIASSGGVNPSVTIGPLPSIQFRSGSAIGCGLEEVWGSGASVVTINVVNFIQYQIGRPQTPVGQAAYQNLYTNSDGGPGEALRTELMRVELDINGNAIPETEEIVAEYAVDLNLQFIAVTAIDANRNPTLGLIAPGSAQFNQFAGPVFGTTNTPQRIRSVRVRLGVRSRAGDRGANVPSPANAGLFRFDLGTGDSEAFARVRTFQADVALHNQADALW